MCVLFLLGAEGFEKWNLLAEGVSQQIGDDLGAVAVVMSVVLLALGLAGFFARTEPHVELLGTLGAQTLFQVVGDAVGIDEIAVHALG